MSLSGLLGVKKCSEHCAACPKTMAVSLVKPQAVDKVVVGTHSLQIWTESLLLTCLKIARVTKIVGYTAQKQLPPKEPQQPLPPPEGDGPRPTSSVVVCDSLTQPDVQSVGIDTVKAIASVVVQLPIKQQYWGIMHWKLEPALAAYAGSLSDVLPDFSREVAVQQAMSACGVSLPMHGSAAVGHGPPGLYTNWLFSEGIVLTQPWLRRLITGILNKHHKSSPHLHMAVGVVFVTRPDCILSDMSLEQARWLQKNSKTAQQSLQMCFATAVERGYVHLAADRPCNIALCVGPGGKIRVYLLNWSQCAERLRIKATDQSDVMGYLMGIVDETVDAAVRCHNWYA
jgi:hypothetical protein